MSKSIPGWSAGVLCAALLVSQTAGGLEADEEIGFERTPPRLAFVDGEVSFWRPGAGDWSPAQVNTALASGDELYTGPAANLELQVGSAAFVRAGENAQLALSGLEPDYLQLRVAEGHLSLDLRTRKPSQTIEIDAPNAAFTIEHTGYYRIEVEGETTTFISRRGGRAVVTTAAGTSAAVAPSEQVVVSGADAHGLETWAAPELDAWDRWNYARTDDQLDAVSARYVPSGVYGVSNLDHYGDWRLVPTYGAVWVPRSVPVGWAPYSTGRWMYDPYYGWTWVDNAPWGWAPYHYGRWVYVSGYWGWCPGRIVARPYYSPALVAFYGGGSFSIGVSFGYPSLGWVALGWGEPLVPWWGPVGFRGVPRWAGWGGPRVVNNVVIQQKTVIRVHDIQHYQNARVRDAVVAVDRSDFGRRSGDEPRYHRVDAGRMKPLHGDLGAKPDRTSLVAATGEARRPSRAIRERSVVAVREPRPDRAPEELAPARRGRESRARAGANEAPHRDSRLPTRLVESTEPKRRVRVTTRPPFGRRGEAERRIAPEPPRFEEARRAEDVRTGRAEDRQARGPEDVQTRREQSRDAAATRTRSRATPDAPEAIAEPSARVERPTPRRPERRRAEPTPSDSLPQQEPSSAGSVPQQAPSPGMTRRSRPQEREAPGAIPGQREREASSIRPLPGDPANQVYRQQRAGRTARESGVRGGEAQVRGRDVQMRGGEAQGSRGGQPRRMDRGGSRGERGPGGRR